ncbi:hypothetical protein M8J75_014817 [Diaphorina citri]|nr:hypothetical protein M8J75_014817 [Diaphorina citri]
MRVHGITMPQQKPSSSPRENNDESSDEIPDTPADISGKDTSKSKEIPLVWVSRQGTISKMHKCRFCPHVNVRKSNIQEHEKMHSARTPKLLADGTTAPPLQQHYCPDCNYICNNAGVLSSHAKVHQGMFGTVCALYDPARSDEDQIKEVLIILSSSKYNPKQVVTTSDNETIETTPDISALLNQSGGREESDSEDVNIPSQNLEEKIKPDLLDQPNNAEDNKLLHFCSLCPARFLYEKELMIHGKFHSLQLTHKCWSCSYTARQEQHLLAHYKVHTDEYQDRTKALLSIYGESPKHPKNKTAVVLDNPGLPGYIWVVVNDTPQYVSMSTPPFSLNFNINNTIINNGKKKEIVKKPSGRVITKQFSCTKCPAQFFKSVALQYHLTLHGGNGPHKCRSCDYAVKTYGNLIKHEQVHDTLAPRVKCKLLKPLKKEEPHPLKAFAKPEYHLKNIDPEFGFLMLGNPNFNYPTYIKNGKVKTKRYKCHKCPSAFEKREQYKVHLSLHGAQQKYKCDKCDYSVKYYANYIQHIRKHEKSESFDDSLAGSENEASTVIEDKKPVVKTQQLSSPKNIEENVMSRLKDEFHLCKFCPYASTNPGALTNHIRKHHNIPHNLAVLLNNESSLSVQHNTSNEDILHSEPKSPDEEEEPEPEQCDLYQDSIEDEVNPYNDEPDDYDDEEIERKFVLSSMRNGSHVDDLEEDDEDMEPEYEDRTHDRDGYLEIDNDSNDDEDDDTMPDEDNTN